MYARRASAVLALAIASPALVTAQSTAADSARRVISAIVARGDAPAVSAAVVSRGRVVWRHAAGRADVGRRTPVTPHSRFALGSISKTFTMAAVMRLVDRGALDLDAPVERYLTDFPHAGKGITLRMLAAHQSGVSDQFAADHYLTTRHFSVLDSAYQPIARGTLEAQPGTRLQYATGLYTIIGRVIERVTGRPYEAALRELVLDPLGLASIAANDPRREMPNRVAFYMRDSSGYRLAPYFDPSHKLPCASRASR
jgi:D-alanyl-D-alanine carboxypeptidase